MIIKKLLYTLEEAALSLNVTLEQIKLFIQKGYLKTINIGTEEKTDLRITLNYLEEFINTLEKQSNAFLNKPISYDLFESFEITLLRINLKSSDNNPGRFCIENGRIGMGWGVNSGTPINDWKSYAALAKEQSVKIDSVSLLQKIPVGSFVWTRQGYRTETRFFLGIITGEWEYLDTPEAKEADVHNVRNCIWVKIGGPDTVIQEIKNSFTPTTLEYIRNKTAILYTKKLVSDLINKGLFPDLIGLTDKKNNY